jgi:hypothetical protein
MDDNFKTLAEDIKIDFFRKVILFSKNDNLENVSLIKISDNLLVAEFNPEIVSAGEIINLLNIFPDYQKTVLKSVMVVALPVVIWEGREVSPMATIILETKPAVSDSERLKEILTAFGKFNVEIKKPDPFLPSHFEITVFNMEPSLNILVLANLIAEDKIHFQWARPEFSPFLNDVAAEMYVTANGVDSLGDKRYLHLEISITDFKINLLKDLVPQLGDGEFVINAADYDDIWFWADKPVIEEKEDNNLKRISFVWPFVYLNTGNFNFKDLTIAFEKEDSNGLKTESSLTVKGCSFKVGSVIDGAEPPIKDIQPIHSYSASIISVSEKSSLKKGNLLEKARDWLWLVGVLIGLILLFQNSSNILRDKWLSHGQNKNRKQFSEWDELIVVVEKLSLENWTEDYSRIESRLRTVLNKILRLPLIISSTTIKDPLLKKIFSELEKIYFDGKVVDLDIIRLKRNLKDFICCCKKGVIYVERV